MSEIVIIESKKHNFILYWLPNQGFAGGPLEVIDKINNYILGKTTESGFIEVSPVGPFIDGSLSNPEAAVFALYNLYGSDYAVTKGELPTPEELEIVPPPEVDEDGFELIY